MAPASVGERSWIYVLQAPVSAAIDRIRSGRGDIMQGALGVKEGVRTTA